MRFIDITRRIWKAFQDNNCFLWAASLTYTTLFALVPLLAVALSLFKAFGGFKELQETILMPIISEILDPTHKMEVLQHVQAYVDRINVGTLGILGTSIFILTFIPLFSSLEKAINNIWGRTENRPFWLKFAMYWAVTTLGPVAAVIIFGSVSFLSKLMPELSFLHTLKPLLVIFIVFSLFIIYKLVPNTEVDNGPALMGAGIGGLIWLISSFLYQSYMKVVTTSFTIYGSLGAIPVFLLWIYINWLVILLGAEIAFFVQFPDYLNGNSKVTPTKLFKASIDILGILFRNIKRGNFLGEKELLENSNYLPGIVSTVITTLTSSGILSAKENILLPSKGADEILVSDLIGLFIGDINEDVLAGIGCENCNDIEPFVHRALSEIKPGIS